jgi:Domain of unknown function (DUF4332)
VSTLISILRAVHCRSTHHFFAIDALDRIDTPNGRRLATVLLANYREYLNGAKDPDTKFKDFQNHVVHISDNNWGGAPKACETWLARTIEDMHNSDWKAAAYSIGVLSHYFSDPLMPLHTAQHPLEAVVHRPLEWSVCKSYDWIYRRCNGRVSFPIETGPGWISKAVLAGAVVGHKHYMPLIEYYNLKKGVLDPPSGLDSRSRAILTEIFDYVLSGWAAILDRIASLAVVEIPICPLSFTAVMAAVDVPAAWIVGRISDIAEQRAVKAIFDEYQATGQVVKNVPPELQVVASVKPLPPKLQPDPVKRLTDTSPPTHIEMEPSILDATLRVEQSAIEPQVEIKPVTILQKTVVPDMDSEQQSANDLEARATRLREPHVNLDSDIVDAPSIGPKTASRFYEIGIATIRQFLAASAADMSNELNVNWIEEETLIDWQDQTRLVIRVPALCGYKAQLLVGVDCRSADALAACEIETLHSAIEEFCSSEAGSRIIRSAAVPSRDEIAKWIQSAAQPSAIPELA